ncbi:MAG TPA: triose-phosphate isomerase [Sphaerochaeta sp.]|jgi:triosephosphate isomerase|nr:triose-phosphate isomerase [Sphaerochaeta sp.]HPB42199.1 triose-phosphate isomerase [Sphaerochaeta sp.]HPY45442.1 triose-phosphate isomerase [Sphaerochaeta sp.]HQB05320.1 triose-phosphate isomerase [Sphaerochaeta sp.]
MKQAYIAGNWKMNMTPSEGAAFAKELVKAIKNTNSKVMVAPPFVTIPAVLEAAKGSSLIVAAQNMANHESGAYTGEVSPLMLKDLGVNDVILGHSERRSIYGECDEVINEKLLLALKHDMNVVFCIGETLEERESGRLEEVLERQVRVGLGGVKADQMGKVTIAYEPVWAIGTGKTATPDDANNAHAFVRSVVEKLFSKGVAEATVIQYGGSVKASNAKALMAMPHIDGALVGGASLSVEQFLPIVNFDK